MNLEIKHYGRVINGRKEYFQPELYRDQLTALNGKNFVEIIKERHEKPSNNQYGYYRGAILITCYKTEMFSHMDNKDSIHEDYFAPKFLSYAKLVTVGGETTERFKVRSLADLTKDEMTEFITKVLAECAELNIEVSDPESYYQKYYQR